MSKVCEIFGSFERVEIEENKQKVYRGPYRYVGTDVKQGVDIYEHNETGEFVGLLS